MPRTPLVYLQAHVGHAPNDERPPVAPRLGLCQLQEGLHHAFSPPEHPRQLKPIPTIDLMPPLPSARGTSRAPCRAYAHKTHRHADPYHDDGSVLHTHRYFPPSSHPSLPIWITSHFTLFPSSSTCPAPFPCWACLGLHGLTPIPPQAIYEAPTCECPNYSPSLPKYQVAHPTFHIAYH